MKAGIALFFPLLLLAGCVVGPNYKRPAVPVPGQYRGAPQGGPESPLAETKWPDLFQDEVLTQLISTALQHNFDLGSLPSASRRRARSSASRARAKSHRQERRRTSWRIVNPRSDH